MPRTQTRAYTHAFVMPEYEIGGAYNYMTRLAQQHAQAAYRQPREDAAEQGAVSITSLSTSWRRPSWHFSASAVRLAQRRPYCFVCLDSSRQIS
ncbi:hypothetical protein LX32DRAFT_45460 [Colletotrichum zoysiae]|uniref:Uncharacterized protein n=1 Tax=Colletotrichum zoysiae TaxID=1216348 RepID=A0AAD9HBA1_9PEZI|nr:hypothetical protein LX32DRAFT_45460 [Colletotrichum zoysiae]